MRDKQYIQSEKVFWRQYNDGVVAINHETNEVILLNNSGAALFSFLIYPRTIQQVVKFLKDGFNVGANVARADAHEFLSSLILKGFIKTAGKITNSIREAKNLQISKSNGNNSEKKYEVMRWAARNLIPISVQIELTHHCNLHCIHCYLSEKDSENVPNLLFLKKLFHQLKGAGTLFLTLTGGEPLLYSNLVNVLDIAVLQCGFSTTIFTNGTIMRKDWKDIISKYSLKEIHVSLYSLHSDIHDEITGVQGSQRLTLNFIKQLLDTGIRVVIKSPLFRQTIEEAPSLLEYVKELGAEWFGGPLITPRDDGDMFPTTMRATRKQIISYFQKIEDSFSIKGDIFQDVFGSTGDSPLACLALSNSCFIDVNGDLYPCSQVRRKIGNVFKNQFEKLWHESLVLERIREVRMNDLKKCSKCKIITYCSRCPGLADLERGDIFDLSPFDCLLAQCRKEAEKQRN